ncbi:serine carboxypeptidase S28 [Coniochaeta ligniaria NRRL 30616]|uniref:Serine carboxypeptidase S28 n=1 Tax=Coniochaeta ligniaria NRRL 30616 TaxID=1408157 RepID=A0A1J7J7N1_9PEZI|nr:serine carboxypeptidase S28 [Coniochaeta ligniaria NRRL 30616]
MKIANLLRLASAVTGMFTGPNGGNATFQQLIDHSNPGLGTFSQWYWWNTTFWNGPGSPVVLFTPGEVEAPGYTGYLTNLTMIGQYAQEIGAATILLEHRFWGESTPYEVLDNKALQYLTLNNSVHDLVYFARNVKLPFDTDSSSNAPQAPWIQVGGSYSGALAAWTESIAPGTYWAYHASSAPVEAVYDYWTYFVPVQKGMPKNCSRDFERIVDYVDGIIAAKNTTEVNKLKALFRLEGLSHDDDFAAAIGWPLGEWQSTQFFSNYSTFYQMCDTMEGVRLPSANGTNQRVSNATVPGVGGIGVGKALPNYAAWFRNEFLPYFCSDNYGYDDWQDRLSVGCFDSYNTTSVMFKDWSYQNTINRQWYWMTCNEPFYYWQSGAPKDRPSIMSRYVTAEYYQRQCDLFFPRDDGNYTYGSAAGRTAETLNSWTRGWDLTDTTRLLWVNGEFDPWRSASVSSEFRPSGPLPSREGAPLFLLQGAAHCIDLVVKNGAFNAGVGAAQKSAIATMGKWVDEFYSLKTGKGSYAVIDGVAE